LAGWYAGGAEMATEPSEVPESMRGHLLARGWQSMSRTREWHHDEHGDLSLGEAINKQLQVGDMERLAAATGVPLTIFAVPKPFEGHIDVIQRNAIRSWKRLRPQCQVMIFGDELGCRDVAKEHGAEHITEIERNGFGTPLLDSVFQLAESRAAFDVLCYLNADLILQSDFLPSVSQASDGNPRYLMAGRTIDVDVSEELARDDENADRELRELVDRAGAVRPPNAIDYFVFPRDTIGPLPPFAVGRPAWDNWMIYRARSLRVPVIDLSASATVLHQTHGYGHVKDATDDKWSGPEARQNLDLLGLPKRNRFSLDDATHLLTSTGLARNPTNTLKRRLRTRLLLTETLVPVYRCVRAIHRALRPWKKALRR
jgi:hypothetical protein